MYILSFFKALFKPSKILTSLYLILNLGIIFALFGLFNMFPVGTENAFLFNGLIGIGINLVCMFIALSPIGEAFFRFLQGIKPLPYNDNNARLFNLFNEVYDKARTVNPKISKKVQLYYMDTDMINAFALGHRTVALTTGAFELEDDHIRALLAHEFGHISNNDSDLTLGIIVSNVFLGMFVFIMKLIAVFVTIVFSILASDNIGGIIASIVHLIFITLLGFVYALWTKIGMLLMNATSRGDEFRADNFAVKCDLGEELIDSLSTIDPNTTKSSALALLSSTHPDTVTRIEKINAALTPVAA